MTRKKLEAALSGGRQRAMYGNTVAEEPMSYEALLQEAYDNQAGEASDGGTAMARSSKRSALLQQMGIDMFDVRKLIPNPENTYSINDESIEALASLIYESKNTTPLVLREIPEGIQIIDGERRYRAHLLLGERYGEAWYMVPARCFKIGTLSDEDARFILHAENIGQRDMLPSERAEGYAAVASRLVAQRNEDPNSAKGRRTAEIIAEQFGVSTRTANMEINIGKNLIKEGLELFDAGEITKVAADALAKLPDVDQQELIGMIKSGKLTKSQVQEAAQGKKRTSTRIPKNANQHLSDAKSALRRALTLDEKPDRVLIAELRNLLDKLDPDSLENRSSN